VAEEPTREQLLIEARLREQLGPERNNYGRRTTQPRSREQPHWHELQAGYKYAIPVLPAQGRAWPDDVFSAYFTDRYAFQYPSDRRHFWHKQGNPTFTVRLVCTPVRRSDDWVLVQRISDGFLAVVPRAKLYFLDSDVPSPF